MPNEIKKDVKHIVTDDIRCYLTEYQANKKSSKTTIDNIRRILSSFFLWLEVEDYILKVRLDESIRSRLEQILKKLILAKLWRLCVILMLIISLFFILLIENQGIFLLLQYIGLCLSGVFPNTKLTKLENFIHSQLLGISKGKFSSLIGLLFPIFS